MDDKTKNWAAFGSEYIKAIDVLNNTDEYAIVDVETREETKNEKKVQTLILHLEREELKKIFGCNKTNAYAVQMACPNKPEDAIGKVITFNKVKVTKPGTSEIVDGLRLVFKNKPEPSQVDTDEAGINEDSTM